MQLVPWCGSILDKYFDQDTMSIHIKENNPILKKKWSPTGWTPVIEWDKLTKDDVSNIIDQIFQEIWDREDAILEIDRSMSKGE